MHQSHLYYYPYALHTLGRKRLTHLSEMRHDRRGAFLTYTLGRSGATWVLAVLPPRLDICRKFHFVSHFVLKSLIATFFIAFKPNYTNIIFSCTMGIETLRSEWKLNEIKEKSSCKNSLIIRHRTQGNTPTRSWAPMLRFIVLQAHIQLASLQIDWFSQGQLPHGLGLRWAANGSAPISYLERCFPTRNRRVQMKQSWLTGIDN